MFAELASRREDGLDLEVLVYRFERALLGVSSAVVGGGIGERRWALNAQVRADYDRDDLARHVGELARDLRARGRRRRHAHGRESATARTRDG